LQCGGNDKSIGWIALVQRYNIPKHVIAQRKEVTSKENAETIVKRSHTTENRHSPSDADAKQLVVYMGESTIDHVPTEHVRCCGHQVTWLCACVPLPLSLPVHQEVIASIFVLGLLLV